MTQPHSAVFPRALLAAPALLLLAGLDAAAIAREQPGLAIGVVLVLFLAIAGVVQTMNEPAFPSRTREKRLSASSSSDSPDVDDWTFSSDNDSSADSCDSGGDSSSCD